MFIEKEFIRPTGKYILRVEFYNDSIKGPLWFGRHLWFIGKGKRKRENVIDEDSREYRNRSFPEGRIQYVQEQINTILTKEEQASAFQELYDLIKPPQLR